MSELPLPHKSEPFTPEGFQKLYEHVRAHPEKAKVIADELESNPKEAIEYAFKLSEEQEETLKLKSKEDLRRVTRVLVHELRGHALSAIELAPLTASGHTAEGREKTMVCSMVREA